MSPRANVVAAEWLDVNDWRKRLRSAVDLTRRTHCSIAEQAGVTPETFSRVLSGRHRQPGFETVVKIIHATGESVGWVLGERQAPLSADGQAMMREIIDFLDSHFPEKPVSRLD
jgi:transcriptional regulator with XRE-family HTH domain